MHEAMMEAQPEPLLLTVDEVCRRLGVCRSTYYNLVRSGQLAARQLRGRPYVETSELRRFLSALPPADVSTGRRRA
ncbi:helix-turn-helix domain-containing protein [Pinisolibacter sp.]|uniref:helix-turn-helix domain-containing protein n=1 Tax=Pinisolibacter sp. TaxID=2172024 RepID=UPI002FDEBD6B